MVQYLTPCSPAAELSEDGDQGDGSMAAACLPQLEKVCAAGARSSGRFPSQVAASFLAITPLSLKNYFFDYLLIFTTALGKSMGTSFLLPGPGKTFLGELPRLRAWGFRNIFWLRFLLS